MCEKFICFIFFNYHCICTMPTTLKTRPEVVAMRWAWLWLIASIIGLVLGLGLVLTFNHLIVVPYLHKGHVIDTDCYVTHIQIVPFEHANCTPFQPGVALKNLNCGRGLPLGTIPELCAKIRVLYYSTEGEMRNGVLHPDYEDTTLYPNDTLKCRCQRCHPEAGIHANAIQPAQNHTPFSDHLNNRDIQEVTLDGKRLHIGTKTRCYYRKRGSQDLYLWHNKGLSVIHAVLWPTLLFIAGFVGLFFSCISLQKSTYLMKLNKRMPSNV